MELPPEFAAEIDEVITHYPVSKRSASLPLLHLFQEKFGWISDEAILWIANKLELQPINILELVTFYPMFRRKAAGKHHIRVCRTLSCAMGGSFELFEHFCRKTGIHPHTNGGNGHGDPVSVSADGEYSIEFVECLASCGTAPVCMINDDFYEGVTHDEASALLEKYP
ncbi:MAG TPA: NAD(P)H-dependent oxidoreductase subunit E [Chthoniobacterales bacterium]